MTATIEETDTSTILWEEIDFAPQCEQGDHTNDDDCPLAAEYKMILSCCAAMFLMCEDHMLGLVNHVKKAKLPQHDPEFGGCGGYPVHFTIIEKI